METFRQRSSIKVPGGTNHGNAKAEGLGALPCLIVSREGRAGAAKTLLIYKPCSRHPGNGGGGGGGTPEP